MKKLILTILILISITMQGCNNTKVIGGVQYGTYGLMNQVDMKNPDINYEISIGSVIAAVILCETVIVPIYVILFDLYQPVNKKSGKSVIGEVN